MFGTPPVSPRNSTFPTVPVHRSGGAVLEVTEWTALVKLGSVEPPASRKQRRAAEQRKSPPTREVRVKLPREQQVALIKKEMREKGVPLPPDLAPTEAASGGWEEWGAQTLQKGLELFKDVVRWMPGPEFAGAASTCDVNGRCEGQIADPLPPMRIKDFRKVASRFSMEMSPSVRKREDKTLRGMVVLVADINHHDPGVQGDIRSLIRGSIQPHDLLLVEQPALEGWTRECLGVGELDAECFPIDTTSGRMDIEKLEPAYETAMARVVRAAIGKIYPEQEATLEELLFLGRGELEKLELRYMREILKAEKSGKPILGPEEKKRFMELVSASTSAAEAYAAKVHEVNSVREQGFRNEIERHAANAASRAIFVVLGRRHVDNIKAWLLASRDAIVLYPR